MSDVRLIDANALCKKSKPMYGRSNMGWIDHVAEGAVTLNEIHKAPTIDAVPVVHGRWESDMYFDEPVMRCTACKRGFAAGHKAERFPYCPNCGAKMDGGADDD